MKGQGAEAGCSLPPLWLALLGPTCRVSAGGLNPEIKI